MTHWPGQRVLVTGGAGFIGSHLAAALVQAGAAVTILDRRAGPDAPNLAHLAGAVTCLAQPLEEALTTLDLTPYTTLFHLAGNPYVPPSVADPQMDYEKNLHTTFRLLMRLKEQGDAQPRFVYASSAAVYGTPTRLPIHEDDPTRPISPYGVSKLASERYVAVFSQLYGVRGASARMFSVYGPRQRQQVIFDLLQKLSANPHVLDIFGDGTQERDFCYVTDAVNALMHIAACAPAQGEVYNVASGQSHSIHQIIAAWALILDVQPQVRPSAVRAGEPERWTVDIGALRRLGFGPQVALEDGMRQMKAWYDAHR